MSSLVFRFKVTFEDVDDVVRVIDVGSKNTFRDFHNAIQESIGFDNLKPASFYKTNDSWRPGDEFCTDPKSTAKAAGASELGKFIDDPHQKFLYVYDAGAPYFPSGAIMCAAPQAGPSTGCLPAARGKHNCVSNISKHEANM